MVDNSFLSDKTISLGETLLTRLDRSVFKPSAFLWFYFADAQTWRLIIAADVFAKRPIAESYRDFIEEFRSNPHIGTVGLENITLLSPRDGLLELLRTVPFIHTAAEDISGIRFKSNVINNVFISDVYIYRLT
ncbi:MAG TPA: hypothetical protein VNG90_05545 [Candidatus Acidoferrum sp.]|nr:hypothetical protein [Candidatus Acidoferrum sp.]